MPRYLGPKKKYLRRFGMIEEKRELRKKKKTDYGLRFEEKQKLKFIYGIREKQLKRYVQSALKTPDPVKTFLQILETRLDNVIYRLGFAISRNHARQVVSHGHVKLNNRRVNIPSYNVQPNEIIMLKENIFQSPNVQHALEHKKSEELPPWLWREKNTGKIINLPEEKELPKEVDAAKVIEFYG